ncbi:contractile injection system tape measure protein [Photorhabdus luminescens]|uniref:contractile injection system tape measure protein n=1 Tax=Photorhabdus luminescens TaxID=29488 RepID=UPI00223FD351|nr:contractile injection system tape measure protein [Photorhabdus luminescens]MCW7760600.1 contractile injection system tape measure protein [Photorhabdus luminescens subsp. venezuelensis]
MPWEPNLFNRIIITIEANNQQAAKKVLYGSLLNKANINNLFNTFFTQYPINQDIYLETLTLDLGEINLHNFNSLFPVRLNTALNKALSQYQINNQEKNTDLKQSKPQKITNISSLLYNNLIDLESFIHYLNQENSISNSMEVIDNHKKIDINIQQLINQLAESENKWALLLAKSCLSEPSLQRLLMLKQPTLLSTINYRLSEKINRSQYLGEPVSPGQLILNALQYIQLNHTQEIPKLDAKVLSHLTTELDNGTLNATSIITLFRQIITQNIPLNSWLKQIWQTIAIARFIKKYLSDEEYQYLLERFTANYTDKNRSNMELTTANINISKIQQEKYLPEYFTSNHTDKNTFSKKSITTHHDSINDQEDQYLPEHSISSHTNKNAFDKISVTIHHDNINTQEEQYLSEHSISSHTNKNAFDKISIITHHDSTNDQEDQYLPEHFISNHTDKNTFGKKLITTHHENINTREEPYLPEHFTQNHTNRNQSSKQSVITDINGKITQRNQYTPEHFVSGHADKNKSNKKLTVTYGDINNTQTYHQYTANQKVISKNHKILSTSNNPNITVNNSSQLQNINKTHSEYILLPKQTLPYQMNNAGILILWPMLPILFNQLGLLEDQKFIHRQAQFSAVNLLNYLIWGKEEIPAERNMLNNVLCGLMVDEMIQLLSLEPEKQLIIDQWLDAIISQLPGWKKLSRNDVRQLFLQRPGELLINEQEIKITVEHQPFDILLSDWPWPLNIAKLPWLDHPLKIDWKNI